MIKMASSLVSARPRRLLILFLAGAASLGLAGCGGGAGGDGGTVQAAVFGNPTNQPTAMPQDLADEPGCPSVEVLAGTASYRVGGGGASDVAHQASLNDVARECTFQGGRMSLKVGVQGRMLIGAAGKPGSYPVPVRIVVKRGDSVVVSRLARVSVSVPPGQGSVPFAHVEEGIALPVSSSIDPADEYTVLVGFDSGGGSAGRRRR